MLARRREPADGAGPGCRRSRAGGWRVEGAARRMWRSETHAADVGDDVGSDLATLATKGFSGSKKLIICDWRQKSGVYVHGIRIRLRCKPGDMAIA